MTRQPRSVAALVGRRQSSLTDGDNFGSPLATYGVSVCGRILTRTAGTVVCVVKQTHYLFSRKLENHAAAVALYFMHPNFGRVHSTLHLIPGVGRANDDSRGALRKSSD
jgi:glucose/arabinose dehydrogenase